MVLCNSFTDTSVFRKMPPTAMFKMMPAFLLKRLLLSHYPKGEVENEIANSIDFVVEQLDSLTQSEIASRLTLNTMKNHVEPQNISNQGIHITVMDVLDICAISTKVREEVYKFYPDAKLAHLKSGGNFPYLSRVDECNM